MQVWVEGEVVFTQVLWACRRHGLGVSALDSRRGAVTVDWGRWHWRRVFGQGTQIRLGGPGVLERS